MSVHFKTFAPNGKVLKASKKCSAPLTAASLHNSLKDAQLKPILDLLVEVEDRAGTFY